METTVQYKPGLFEVVMDAATVLDSFQANRSGDEVTLTFENGFDVREFRTRLTYIKQTVAEQTHEAADSEVIVACEYLDEELQSAF